METLTLQKVEEAIQKISGVTDVAIKSQRRDAVVADARHMIWYIAMDFLGISSPVLGVRYGKDHTTVLHGVERMRKSATAQAIVEKLRGTLLKNLPEKPAAGEPRSMALWDVDKLGKNGQ